MLICVYKMKTELHLARRYLFRGKAKHISFIGLVSCAGVALGVWALIVVISVMNGFDRDLMDRLMKFNYHLTIESIERERLTKLKDFLKDIKEVESSSLFIQTQIFVKFDNYTLPLLVRGIDFTNERELNLFLQYVSQDNKQEGWFIGEGIAKRFLVSKKLEYYPIQRVLELKEAPLRGTFKVGLYDIDNNYIITDLKQAEAIAPQYLLFLGVRIKDPFKANRVKELIRIQFKERVFINTWMENNRVLFSALKLEKLVMFIILSLISLVASFNIFATLTVKVVEKTKDIGILRALGFTAKAILTIFSLQGLLLGTIGTIAGGVSGLGVCFILRKYPFIKLPEEIYYIEYLPVAINYRDIFLIVFLGILLSYISSLAPALRASRMSTSCALRYE